MSNFRPDFNKQHTLGKPPTDLNDLSTAIRWKDLWVGAIDADEKININTNELPDEQGELSLDAITTSGNIRQTDGYLFIPEWQNRTNLINVAEEIKNLKEDLLNINPNNNNLDSIQGINLIDISNEQQYDATNKIITIYTDDIPEVAGNPNAPLEGEPHLWWTQNRFDAAFNLKNSTDLNDSNQLLRVSQLNDGTSQEINDVNKIIPQLNVEKKIPLEFLPENVNQNVQVSKVYSGTDAARILAANNPSNLIEGDIWKTIDQQQLSYIWITNPNAQWAQLTQPISFDYIKSINQDLPDPSTNAQFVRPNLPSLDPNGQGNVVLKTNNIPEPVGLVEASSLMYFSRDRVKNSIISGDDYITIGQDNITKQTQISFNLNALQQSNISFQDIYNSINVDGTIITKNFNAQTQKIDIKFNVENFLKLFSNSNTINTTLIPNPIPELAAVASKAVSLNANIPTITNYVKQNLITIKNILQPLNAVFSLGTFTPVKPNGFVFTRLAKGSYILDKTAAHDADAGTILVLKAIDGLVNIEQKRYSINGAPLLSNNIILNVSDPAQVYQRVITTNNQNNGCAWVRIF